MAEADAPTYDPAAEPVSLEPYFQAQAGIAPSGTTWGDYSQAAWIGALGIADSAIGLSRAFIDRASTDPATRQRFEWAHDDLAEYIQSQVSQLSPDAQRALSASFLPDEGEDSAWNMRSLGLKLAAALPATLVSAGLGGLAARALLAGTASRGAALTGGAVAGGASEGGMAAGDLYNHIADQIRSATDEELLVNPTYGALRDQGMFEEDAKQELLKEIALSLVPLQFGVSATLGAVTGRLGAQVAAGRGAGVSRLGAIRSGAGQEAGTEFLQSAAEQGIAQSAEQQARLRGLTDPRAIAAAGIEGAVLGGALGGGLGALAGPGHPPFQPLPMPQMGATGPIVTPPPASPPPGLPYAPSMAGMVTPGYNLGVPGTAQAASSPFAPQAFAGGLPVGPGAVPTPPAWPVQPAFGAGGPTPVAAAATPRWQRSGQFAGGLQIGPRPQRRRSTRSAIAMGGPASSAVDTDQAAALASDAPAAPLPTVGRTRRRRSAIPPQVMEPTAPVVAAAAPSLPTAATPAAPGAVPPERGMPAAPPVAAGMPEAPPPAALPEAPAGRSLARPGRRAALVAPEAPPQAPAAPPPSAIGSMEEEPYGGEDEPLVRVAGRTLPRRMVGGAVQVPVLARPKPRVRRAVPARKVSSVAYPELPERSARPAAAVRKRETRPPTPIVDKARRGERLSDEEREKLVDEALRDAAIELSGRRLPPREARAISRDIKERLTDADPETLGEALNEVARQRGSERVNDVRVPELLERVAQRATGRGLGSFAGRRFAVPPSMVTTSASMLPKGEGGRVTLQVDTRDMSPGERKLFRSLDLDPSETVLAIARVLSSAWLRNRAFLKALEGMFRNLNVIQIAAARTSVQSLQGAADARAADFTAKYPGGRGRPSAAEAKAREELEALQLETQTNITELTDSSANLSDRLEKARLSVEALLNTSPTGREADELAVALTQLAPLMIRIGWKGDVAAFKDSLTSPSRFNVRLARLARVAQNEAKVIGTPAGGGRMTAVPPVRASRTPATEALVGGMTIGEAVERGYFQGLQSAEPLPGERTVPGQEPRAPTVAARRTVVPTGSATVRLRRRILELAKQFITTNDPTGTGAVMAAVREATGKGGAPQGRFATLKYSELAQVLRIMQGQLKERAPVETPAVAEPVVEKPPSKKQKAVAKAKQRAAEKAAAEAETAAEQKRASADLRSTLMAAIVRHKIARLVNDLQVELWGEVGYGKRSDEEVRQLVRKIVERGYAPAEAFGAHIDVVARSEPAVPRATSEAPRPTRERAAETLEPVGTAKKAEVQAPPLNDLPPPRMMFEGASEATARASEAMRQDKGARAAVARTVSALQNGRVVKVSQLLDDMARSATTPFVRELARLLHNRISNEHDIPIELDYTSGRIARVTSPTSLAREGKLFFNPQRADDTYVGSVGALLHEAAHVATIDAINAAERQNSREYQTLRAFYEVYASMYGQQPTTGRAATNILEFAAYALSDPITQEVLANTPVPESLAPLFPEPSRPKTLWRAFITTVKRMLGFSTVKLSMLDAVLRATSPFVGGRADAATAAGSPVDANFTAATAAVRQFVGTSGLEPLWLNVAARATGIFERARGVMLGTMTLRQIADTYEKLFTYRRPDGSEANAIREYMQANANLSADARRHQEEGDRIVRRWLKAAGSNPDMNRVLNDIMLQSTYNRMDAAEDLNHANNRTVRGRATQVAYDNARKQWNELGRTSEGKEFQAIYREARDYFASQRAAHKKSLLENMLRRTGSTLTLSDVDTYAKVDALAPGAIRPGLKRALLKVHEMAEVPGAYFPLRRYGDHVVVARASIDQDMTAQEFDAFVAANPGAEITATTMPSGKIKVTGNLYQVEFFENLAEANTRYQELKAAPEFANGEVQPPQRRRATGIDPSMMNHVVMRDIGRQLKQEAKTAAEGDRLMQILADAAIRYFPDTYIRKADLQRTYVTGASTDMLRATSLYTIGSAYYQAKLDHGWRLDQAMDQMQSTADLLGSAQAKDVGAAQRAAQDVITELRTRNDALNDFTPTPAFVGRLSDIGFAWYLGSPSNWIMNLLQPLVVTLPVMAARYGYGASVGALHRAMKLVGPDALRKGLSETGRGLLGKLTPDSFNLLDQIKANITRGVADPIRRRDLLRMIDDAGREGLIDLSFGLSLRETARPTTTSGRAIDYMADLARTMPHAIEMTSRVVTGIATYELARSRGQGHEQAVDAAKRVIAETLFDYSVGNKARFMNPRGFPAARLVFMFKQFAQHIYYLMVSNTVKSFNGASPQERAEARKALAGLLASHAIIAGAIGASFEPVKWAIALTMLAFGDDEPFEYEKNVRLFMADMFGPEVGQLLSRGAPYALGADLSSRMGINDLLFFGDYSLADRQGVNASLVSLAGPVVGAGVNFFDGISMIQDGNIMRGAAQMTPKLVRDALTTARLGSEGMTDRNGNRIDQAIKLSPADLFVQALGFGPSKVREVQAFRYAVQSTERRLNETRANLMDRYWRARGAERLQVWRERIQPFNAENPTHAISYDQLMRSQQERERRQGETGRAGGVYLPRTRQSLLEEGRFASF